MDPTDSSLLYAATNGGLYRSVDAGATWLWSSALDSCCSSAVAVDPAHPWVVYLSGFTVLRRSDDRGRTWIDLPNPFPSGVNSLAVGPGRRSTVYAATAMGQLLRSRDKGRTWEVLPFEGVGPRNLVIHPRRPEVVFLIDNAGAYKSQDGGRTWSSVLPPGSSAPRALAVAPSQPETVYVATVGGTYRSRDESRTWVRLPPPTPPEILAWELAVAPDDPETLYAATDGGVKVSSDGGQSWQDASAGLPADSEGVLRVQSLVVDHERPEVLYAGMVPNHGSPYVDPGVAKSWNRGRRWWVGFQHGLSAVGTRVSFDPRTPGSIYVSINPAGGWPIYLRAFRSLDSGRHWSPFPLPPGGASDLQLGRGTVYVANEGGVWRSTNDGARWQRIDRVPALALGVTGRGVILASGSRGLRRSTDNGRTWKQTLYYGDRHDLTVSKVIVLPGDPTRVYLPAVNFAGTGPPLSILRSEDAGATWSTFIEGAHILAIAASDPRVIYVARPVPTEGTDLLRSQDRGRTWTEVSSFEISPNVLAVDPWDPDTVYNGGTNVYRSVNGGVTWEVLDPTFTRMGRHVFGLTADPWTCGRLYVFGFGLFELQAAKVAGR
jgi:photosystem II stability/assembly factor-like uncharacterized protein